MKKQIKNLRQFEALSETSDGFLVSGFSTSLSSNTATGGLVPIEANLSCPKNTNCAGGNCVAGCGAKTA
ncbi:hypothetical protein [Mucilaginibacter flavus]|uniref:hypothetical protein n=1 Tax=Mucilaginibacter flavus TaxID=931504 RepID=UPI0025B56E57|nr:hypothetical protein [Mucilaginibacter flavus]MDN3580928.1 hypothetical protein [Mucilaginibacter flavus]